MRKNGMLRRSVALGLSVAALGIGALATAGTASASEKDGTLSPGEFGLYYNQNQSGYVFDLYYKDTNFGGEAFPHTGTSVNDNTESYWNRDEYVWDVYTDAEKGGIHGWIPVGMSSNASFDFKNTISSAYPR